MNFLAYVKLGFDVFGVVGTVVAAHGGPLAADLIWSEVQPVLFDIQQIVKKPVNMVLAEQITRNAVATYNSFVPKP